MTSVLGEAPVVVRSMIRRPNRLGDTMPADGDALLASARLVVGTRSLDAEPLSLAAPRVPRDLLELVPSLQNEPTRRTERR